MYVVFELDAEVRKWRTGLERGSSLSARELDELEDHLRARVDLELELDPALAAGEALAIAQEGLGQPKALSMEFTRAGRPRWRRLLLAGWAMYAVSFLLPAYGYSRHDAELTTYGYEIFPELVRLTTSGPAWAVGMLWLPNLILLMTLPAWRRRRPSPKAWTAWIVGATGALPLGLGLVRFGDPGAPFHSGIGFWVWCASFVVVATALWFRSRDWASVQPTTTEVKTFPYGAVLLLAAGSATIPGEAGAQDGVGVASGWIVNSEPGRIYGWVEDAPDSEFSAVVGVVYGPDGRIAVADRTLAAITVFTADGTVMATMGRAGDGPGEFRRLAGIAAGGEDRIVAFDGELQRLSEWTFDGSLSDDTRLSRTGAARRIGEIGRFADGDWYAREQDRMVATDPGGVGRDTVGFHRLRQDGVVDEALARVPGSLSSQFVVEGMPGIRGALFSPRALSAARGNCLLLAAGDGPVVQIFDRTGTARGELHFDVPVERVTEEHRERWVAASVADAERAMGGEIVPEAVGMIEVMAEAVGMAERVPFANDLIVDDLGYIWIQSWQLPHGLGSPDWRVFTETGRGIGTVRSPDGLRVLDISAGALTGVRTDEFGRQFVQVHALDRRGDVERRPLPPGCG